MLPGLNRWVTCDILAGCRERLSGQLSIGPRDGQVSQEYSRRFEMVATGSGYLRLRAGGRGALMVVAGLLLVAATSSPALADTTVPPGVAVQPETAVLFEPEGAVSYSASAQGTPAPSVQWQWSADRSGPWVDIPGATSSTLNFTASEDPQSMFALGHAFRAVFTNSAGTASSRAARLVWRAQWMRDLGSEIANIPLNELTIPGSHDMGTYGITGSSPDSTDGQAVLCSHGDAFHTVCENYARAQDPIKDATHELNEGIRYFDLRVCAHAAGVFVTCHGIEAAGLAEILAQTRAWVDTHPGEVVILDFNHHFFPQPLGTVIPSQDLEAEASAIDQAFALPGGGSLMIPPQNCGSTDPAVSPTPCVGGLTLQRIRDEHLGSVIVNFENDDAPGGCINVCTAFSQPLIGLSVYDNHPRLWGRGPTPNSVPAEGGGICTPAAVFTSCFGGDPLTGIVLSRVQHTIHDRNIVAGVNRFFVQFLQTTPDTGYIALNPTGSLFDMAQQSNPYIGKAIFDSAPLLPENLNILALNFYNRTQYGSNTFDFVAETIMLDEYARTPPVIQVSSPLSPAATGWYNAATLATHQNKLQVDFRATDYKYFTGIHSFTCSDTADPSSPLIFGGVPGPINTVGQSAYFADGLHTFDCTAEDDARGGFHGYGNRGAGPGSTSLPLTFNVDVTPPTLAPTVQPVVLHGSAVASPNATDATSGIQSATCGAIDSTTAGIHTVTCTATDRAGNSTTSGPITYLVAYNLLGFFTPAPTSKWKIGQVVPIKLALTDANNVPIPDTEAQALANACRVSFATTGAQTTTGCLKYDTKAHQFVFNWKIAQPTAGPTTIKVAVSYPGTAITTDLAETITITT